MLKDSIQKKSLTLLQNNISVISKVFSVVFYEARSSHMNADTSVK